MKKTKRTRFCSFVAPSYSVVQIIGWLAQCNFVIICGKKFHVVNFSDRSIAALSIMKPLDLEQLEHVGKHKSNYRTKERLGGREG